MWCKTQVDVWPSHPGVRTISMKSHAHVHTPHPNTRCTHLHRCDIRFIVLLNLSLVCVWARKSSWIKKNKPVDTSYFLREHPAQIAQRNEQQLYPFARRCSRNTETQRRVTCLAFRRSPTRISVWIVGSFPQPRITAVNLSDGLLWVGGASCHTATCLLTGFLFDFIHFRHQWDFFVNDAGEKQKQRDRNLGTLPGDGNTQRRIVIKQNYPKYFVWHCQEDTLSLKQTHGSDVPKDSTVTSAD